MNEDDGLRKDVAKRSSCQAFCSTVYYKNRKFSECDDFATRFPYQKNTAFPDGRDVYGCGSGNIGTLTTKLVAKSNETLGTELGRLASGDRRTHLNRILLI